MTHDGLGKYLSQIIEKAPGPTADVVGILKERKVDVVVSYLPVGSEEATKWYVEQALQAGVGFVNCIPVFIAREPYWQRRFAEKGLPIIGDDIKSQVGATISHRVLTRLFMDRGVRLDRTYQLNFGGNTDFLNMLERERLESKKISKTNAVTSMLDYDIDPDNIHVGPSDHVPWLLDRKWCYIRMEGTTFGDVPLNVELKLEVWDSPNSAGVVIDAIRCLRLGLDRGLKGTLVAPSAYFMKTPPIQIHDDIAFNRVEAFIRGEDNETLVGTETLPKKVKKSAPVRGGKPPAPSRPSERRRLSVGSGTGGDGAATRSAIEAGEAASTGRRLGAPKAHGEAAPEPTKQFEAPAQAGEGDLPHPSRGRARRSASGGRRRGSSATCPAGPVYRVGGWLSMIGYAASPLRRRWLRSNFGHVLGVSPERQGGPQDGPRRLPQLLPLHHGADAAALAQARSRSRTCSRSTASTSSWRSTTRPRAWSSSPPISGNNEAAAAGFAKHGLQINVVGDDSSYRELYELFERQRESWGVKMISWRNLRGVYGALRRREGLVLLVDWGYRADDIPVKMFGAWTTLPAGPADPRRQARLDDRAVLDQPPARRARSRPPPTIRSTSRPNSPADLAIATQKIATALEGHIAPAPEQWYIFKPIWPATAGRGRARARRPETSAAMANDAKGAAPPDGGESRRAAAGTDDRQQPSDLCQAAAPTPRPARSRRGLAAPARRRPDRAASSSAR